MVKIKFIFYARIVVLLAITLIAISCKSTGRLNDYIRPYTDNPYYWQYKGDPVILLGGTWQDNLFNHPVGLERHLDLLLESGGNYVRNVMSHRNTGNVYAYAQSGEELAFGDYWADYIHQKAQDIGCKVYVTDMRRNANLRASDHYHIYDNEERFNYLDVAQNSWMTGQQHYDQILFVRDYINEAPRPINTVKIYNRDGAEESMARFFRIIFVGGASARFHRPAFRDDIDAQEISTSWGLGLGPRAQTTIRSARMLVDSFDLFASRPGNDLFSERAENEAYALVNQGEQYAVYFPDGGNVILNVSDAQGQLQLRWLDINDSTWQDTQYVEGGGSITLQAPGSGHWAIVIKKD